MDPFRTFLFLATCASAIAAAPATPSKNDAQRRPNVVIFLTDDQGCADLGFYGNRAAKTPQIDRFARESVELTQFHVSPVCSPTRASLMTGRYNFRTGVSDVFGPATVMNSAEVTLAEMLRAAGYATGLFGKWHLGDDPAHGPNAQGFDDALTFRGPTLTPSYFDPKLRHNGEEKTFKGYCMDIFTDAAIEFVRRNREKPFFLYLPTNLIHGPFVAPEDLVASYREAGADEINAKVYGMLESVDRNFGRLRAALQELGLEENTLLMFLSDNGTASEAITPQSFSIGLHGFKGTPYQNGLRVPCFARWPAGFPAPARMQRLTAHIDVLPTVLEACGVPTPGDARLDGRSFLSLLREPAGPWPADRTLFFQWDSGQTPRRGHACAVVTERYKLVQPTGMDSPRQQHIRDKYARVSADQGRGSRTIEGAPRWELYDLQSDPGETKDRSAELPEVVARMRRHYEAWFDDVSSDWRNATAVK